jgi:UPF0176 protein
VCIISYNLLFIIVFYREGINGTIAGLHDDMKTFICHIKEDPCFASIDIKYSQSDEAPFYHMRVHSKPEIVTMGIPDINPNTDKGTYVEPEDWNSLISDPDTILIDTRNDYEIRIGKFKGAVVGFARNELVDIAGVD